MTTTETYSHAIKMAKLAVVDESWYAAMSWINTVNRCLTILDVDIYESNGRLKS
jgi:hypothetical protein